MNPWRPRSNLSRRTLLKTATATALAASIPSLSGCLDDTAELEYPRWMPAEFDATALKLDVSEMLERDVDGRSPDEPTDHGLTLGDADTVLDLERATVVELTSTAEPTVEGEAVDEHHGATVYQQDRGVVATDGDTIVEASTPGDVEAVLDARVGETPRLHEEDPVFDALSRHAGAGTLVLSHEPEDGHREVRSGRFTEDGARVTVAVAAPDGRHQDVEDRLRAEEHLAVEETRAGVESVDGFDVFVAEASATPEELSRAFGLEAEASGSHEVDEVDESSASIDSSGEVDDDPEPTDTAGDTESESDIEG